MMTTLSDHLDNVLEIVKMMWKCQKGHELGYPKQNVAVKNFLIVEICDCFKIEYILIIIHICGLITKPFHQYHFDLLVKIKQISVSVFVLNFTFLNQNRKH